MSHPSLADAATAGQPRYRSEPGAEAVLVVVVNYRTAALTARCLRSIAACRDELRGGGVVVVDNSSGDGSFEALSALVEREGWHSVVRIVAAPRNDRVRRPRA